MKADEELREARSRLSDQDVKIKEFEESSLKADEELREARSRLSDQDVKIKEFLTRAQELEEMMVKERLAMAEENELLNQDFKTRELATADATGRSTEATSNLSLLETNS